MRTTQRSYAITLTYRLDGQVCIKFGVLSTTQRGGLKFMGRDSVVNLFINKKGPKTPNQIQT